MKLHSDRTSSVGSRCEPRDDAVREMGERVCWEVTLIKRIQGR